MTFLRAIVLSFFTLLLIYTIFVVSNHGMDFITGFVTDVFSVTWRGQINIDFAFYLLLSGLWVAWRHHYSSGGIALALAVMVGGMLLFAPYLLYAIKRSDGDLLAFLLGDRHAPAHGSA